MKSVGNLKRRRLRSATALIVPVAVGALCLVGVVAPPAVSLQAARLDNGRLVSEVSLLEQSAAEFAAIEREGGGDRILAAIERLQALVPGEIPDLELQALVRTAAELAGIRLDSLALGPVHDVGLPKVEEDYIGARAVRLSAQADPARFVDFVEKLRSLGVPASVVDLSLVRTGSGETSFLVEATVELFEHTSPPSDLATATETPDE